MVTRFQCPIRTDKKILSHHPFEVCYIQSNACLFTFLTGNTIRRLPQSTMLLNFLNLGCATNTAYARLACAVLLSLSAATAHPGSRETYHSQSPLWLQAVGKLQVPGIKYSQGYPRNYRESCSATLIARSSNGVPTSAVADTIVTAWHCLEFYNDLSKTITFTLMYGTENSFSSEAVRVADGGSMHADWAVLRLLQPVPGAAVSALAIHPDKANPLKPISMAGYSRNNPQQRLSYDLNCSITSALDKGSSASNCSALKGSSGGAVMQRSSAGKPLLAGVISQGDSQDLSLFVPVDAFRRALNASLK